MIQHPNPSGRWQGPELAVQDGAWRVSIPLHTDKIEDEARAILKRVRWTAAQLYAAAGDTTPILTWDAARR